MTNDAVEAVNIQMIHINRRDIMTKKEQPKLAVDAFVLVRNQTTADWKGRHFCRWEGDEMVCWAWGRTKWSLSASQSKSRESFWKEWKIPNEEDMK